MAKDKTDLFTNVTQQEDTKHIYTVSEITQDIKLILENTFGQVWIEGEVSNFRPSSSRHFYFSLKDDKALLNAVMFNGESKGLKFKIEDGLKVICFGNIEVYAPYGKYQIIVERVEPKGIGSLQLALEQLKQRLEKEGLFSAEHKRPIPYLPKNIGVVTSSTGAAIKDILKVLDRRFKDVHIIVNPVRVQGEGAKEEIAQAINDFNCFNKSASLQEQVEVLIVGRGGGSIEDLWAFNEEIVARAIYDSNIPVISAVGHERDWTVADLVADLRAPTPSAAAEQVIPRKEDLREKLDGLMQDVKKTVLDMAVTFEESLADFTHRLSLAMAHIRELNGGQLETLTKKMALLNPRALIPRYQDTVHNLAKQIYVRMSHFLQRRESGFYTLTEKASSLNPLNILSRGYSVTFRVSDGQIIKKADAVNVGDAVKTRVHKGEFVSKVTEVKKDA
jgi:exodeoxyribonuclease VII large subunit